MNRYGRPAQDATMNRNVGTVCSPGICSHLWESTTHRQAWNGDNLSLHARSVNTQLELNAQSDELNTRLHSGGEFPTW